MVIQSGSMDTVLNIKNRTGIFGGSFNPPHIGHLIVSQYAIELLKLDLLYVVPTYIPPHRPNNLAQFDKRFEWCKITFEDPRIVVSDFEKARQDVSYSLYTVRYFAQLHKTKPYFITGEDSLSYIEKWYRYQELLQNCFFVVYPRFCGRPYERKAKKVLGKLYETIIFLKAPLVQLSASEIRERIKEKKSIRGMVHPQIEKQVIEYYSL